MGLLIDEVKRFSLGELNPHIVVADKLGGWLMEQTYRDKEEGGLMLRLLRAPQRNPFPDTWVEMPVRFQGYDPDKDITRKIQDGRIGMYIREINGPDFRAFLSHKRYATHEGPIPPNVPVHLAHELRKVWINIHRDNAFKPARERGFWAYDAADHFHFTMMYTDVNPGRVISYSISARDSKGVILGNDTDPDGHKNIYQIATGKQITEQNADQLFLVNSMFYMVMVLFHTRGMEVIRHDPDPNAVRARLARKRPPPVQYHTIGFPGVRFSSAAEEREYQGVIPAHLVRGHFVDYTQGVGLFGKYHQLVWRPMHVRGNPERGVVLSEYEAHVPERITA